MTQIEAAENKTITALIKKVAKAEKVPCQFILDGLKQGTIVIPANRLHRLKEPCAIGKGLRIKINANIGTSPSYGSVSEELKKLDICLRYKADTVMDLSTGNNLIKVRKAIIKNSPIPVGTVPIYEMAVLARRNKVGFEKVSVDDMFEVIRRQAEDGVDFFTIHAGVTQKVLRHLKRAHRVAGIVSRGGAIVSLWMKKNRRENPFYENFDRMLSLVKEYDITLSLGDGLRPGSVCDATDSLQIEELKVLGELGRRAKQRGVQTIVEGPGHLPISHIENNIRLQKRLCNNAPFYVLGPLVTDVAAGYDHISSAIGAAMAGYYGADFLCYVTPSEHLSIPTPNDVREGIIAYRIAAHSADIAKGLKGSIEWDRRISRFRKLRMWSEQMRNSLDPQRAAAIHKRSKTKSRDVCSMCDEYCAMKISEEELNR